MDVVRPWPPRQHLWYAGAGGGGEGDLPEGPCSFSLFCSAFRTPTRELDDDSCSSEDTSRPQGWGQEVDSDGVSTDVSDGTTKSLA